MGKSKKTAEKYFHQKHLFILEIVSILIAIAGMIIFTFVWGSGPVGIFISAVGIAGFVVCFESRVKDADIEKTIKKITEENVTADPSRCIKAFDLKRKLIVKGRDAKLRTDHFYITEIIMNPVITVKVWRIDLIENSVNFSEYPLADAKAHLEEVLVSTKYGNIKTHSLHCPLFDAPLPVTIADYQSNELIKVLCGAQEGT